MAELKSAAVLPYVQAVSEPLRCCLNNKAKNLLTKGNRRLSETKWRSLQDSPRARQSLHRVNAEEAYAGEDQRTRQGYTTRPYPEHAHETGHYPIWNEVRFIDGDPQSYTRRVKQAVHIRLLPNNIKWWE